MMSSERPSNFFQPQPSPLTTSVENTIEGHLPNYSEVDEFAQNGLKTLSSWNPEATGKNSPQTRISSNLVNKSKENTTSLDTNGKTPKPDNGHSKGQISSIVGTTQICPVKIDIATPSSNSQHQKRLSGTFEVVSSFRHLYNHIGSAFGLGADHFVMRICYWLMGVYFWFGY